MKKQKRKMHSIHDADIVLIIGIILFIIGIILSLYGALIYSEPVPEGNFDLGQIAGDHFHSNEPCRPIALMFSCFAIGLGLIGFSEKKYDIAMIGCVFLIGTLVIISMVLGFVAFIIFFFRGFRE